MVSEIKLMFEYNGSKSFSSKTSVNDFRLKDLCEERDERVKADKRLILNRS